MTRLLSKTFRSVKLSNPNASKPSSSSSIISQSQVNLNPNSKSKSRSWCVYLIISTNTPIKTYVGVTNDFSRRYRLKQHNGELKGGAKASRAGRPWVCACLIRGFCNQSEACEFESKWKSFSRKLLRKRNSEDMVKQMNDSSLPLLQHRHRTLNRVKTFLDCSHLEIDWQLSPF